MKLILQEDVKNLGKMGDMVNVADGYARNYLIPKKMGVEANVKNIKALDHEKRKIEEKAKKVRHDAQGLAERLSSTAITLNAKAGEEERLFGSITTMDIADALKKEGFDIEKKKILLDEPIKRLGTYTVGIKIHHDVTAQLEVKVIAE
jgi:large subunit ribosomal protein L9